MSTAWHRNWDSQWHDSDVRRCQRDKHHVESCADVSAERDEKQERDYTLSRNCIKSTKHFDFWRSFLEIDQIIELFTVWRFVAECKQLTIANAE